MKDLNEVVNLFINLILDVYLWIETHVQFHFDSSFFRAVSGNASDNL